MWAPGSIHGLLQCVSEWPKKALRSEDEATSRTLFLEPGLGLVLARSSNQICWLSEQEQVFTRTIPFYPLSFSGSLRHSALQVMLMPV